MKCLFLVVLYVGVWAAFVWVFFAKERWTDICSNVDRWCDCRCRGSGGNYQRVRIEKVKEPAEKPSGYPGMRVCDLASAFGAEGAAEKDAMGYG